MPHFHTDREYKVYLMLNSESKLLLYFHLCTKHIKTTKECLITTLTVNIKFI